MTEVILDFKNTDSKLQHYRPNVGICLINKEGLIFAGNRFKDDQVPGWQMPQGGVRTLEDAELLEEDMFRELQEETGLTTEKVKILAKSEQYSYDFPLEIQRKYQENQDLKFKNIKGQRQIWFYLKFLGTDGDINLESDPQYQEFFSWKWASKEFLLKNVVEMKKNVYTEVLENSPTE